MNAGLFVLCWSGLKHVRHLKKLKNSLCGLREGQFDAEGEGAHGCLEQSEQPVDPLNAGKQEVTAVRGGPVGDKK